MIFKLCEMKSSIVRIGGIPDVEDVESWDKVLLVGSVGLAWKGSWEKQGWRGGWGQIKKYQENLPTINCHENINKICI